MRTFLAFHFLAYLSIFIKTTKGTIFGIRIVDAPQSREPQYHQPQYQPSYKPHYKPNIIDGISNLKAGALRTGANALRFKGDVLYGGADALDQTANQFSPAPRQQQSANLHFRPPPIQSHQTHSNLNFANTFGNNFQHSTYNNPPPTYNNPNNFNNNPNNFNNNNNLPQNGNPDVITINNQGFNNGGREPDVLIGDPRIPNTVDPGLLTNEQMMLMKQNQAQQMMMIQEQKMKMMKESMKIQTELMKVKDTNKGPKIQQCEERFTQLVGDIFIGNEMVPDVIDTPPKYPLELTYRTVRTFPGMRLTAETTRFKPMVEWPSEEGDFYTLVLANLDINTRRNRTLAEFWHWFVANIPGDAVDDGEVIFDLLFPLVLPEGDGDHRFGYFVMKQPRRIDYSAEGGPTDSCSPNMSKGRGPKRSVKELIRRYDLELTASTFLIIDSDQASLEIACEWQRCMGGQSDLDILACADKL